jgi:hypothetical protein
VTAAARAAGLWLGLAVTAVASAGAATPVRVSVRWDEVLRTNRTLPTLQVVATPMLRRDSPIHGQAFAALAALGCEQVRWVPWLPYPRMSVAALEPPSPGVTSWDFSEMDPMLADFMAAQAGRSVMVDFSVIPQWMFVTDVPVRYPDDPREVTWAYQQGTELRDPSLEELAGYYRRILEWYTRGGFVDEWGMWHASGHHYRFDWWEVLNEPNAEHRMTPAQYTRRYDAIVQALHAVDPSMKFVGLSLSFLSHNTRWFKWFLKKTHHRPGVPLDMISYHFYGWVRIGPGRKQADVFRQADVFFRDVRRVEAIRERLAPEVQTTVNEAGALAFDEVRQPRLDYVQPPIPESFWNLSGALFAYLYAGLSRIGVESVAQSALAQYPGQFPSATMLDWNTGEPNARYWVLKLLVSELGPGDAVVASGAAGSPVHAQAYVKPDGRRRVLLVNTMDQPATVTALPAGDVVVVEQPRGWQMPAPVPVPADGTMTLAPHAVAVVRDAAP